MSAGCFHCGLPVPAGTHWHAVLLGSERSFCCAGCEAVALTIASAGLGDFYATRETASATAPDPRALAPAERYDDPAAQWQFVAQTGANEREAVLLLDGIRCAACAWLCERTLRALPGVLRADVSIASRRAVVAWDERRVRLSQAINALRGIGYDAGPGDPRRQDALRQRESRRSLWRLFVAGFGAMQGMMYAFPAYMDEGAGTLTPDVAQLMRWAGLLMTLPVILFSCAPFFQGALRELRQGRIGLDAPIALGIAGGFAASAWAVLGASGEVYFDSISMLVFLLLAARHAEAAARDKAGRSLDRLHRWMPDVALRLKDAADWSSAASVPAHALVPGDFVLVPAGGRIAADGEVIAGESSTDESLLSGESRPVAKSPGFSLVAGSVNLEQALVMRVRNAGAQTRAAAIARLVERAGATRPRLIESADRIAGALTVFVLATAALAALYWMGRAPDRALWVAVAVLVASCPCALALAAPIVLARAQGELLEEGAALTRARALETLTRVTDVVFDKTGTLTTGRVSIAQARALGHLDIGRCTALALAMQSGSNHPIARAFQVGQGGAAIALAAVCNVPGQGVEARFEGWRLRLGTAAFCAALFDGSHGKVADEPTSRTLVYLADPQGWLARFELEDAARPEAAGLLAGLRASGLRLHLLSGDRAEVAQELADRLGIGIVRAGANPEDKLAYVEAVQREGRIVAMIGDGLNDAQVLARADVSIAMAGGVEAAQRHADVVLLGGGLGAVANTFDLAKRAMRVIRQNFAWAVGYNVIVLPLAAAGWIGPWQAALGMAASSAVVMVNSLRGRQRAESIAASPRPMPEAA